VGEFKEREEAFNEKNEKFVLVFACPIKFGLRGWV
jgi:hypothetical protein